MCGENFWNRPLNFGFTENFPRKNKTETIIAGMSSANTFAKAAPGVSHLNTNKNKGQNTNMFSISDDICVIATNVDLPSACKHPAMSK